jgi:hypothetical protein
MNLILVCSVFEVKEAGAYGKTIVFGVLKRQGNAYTEIVQIGLK